MCVFHLLSQLDVVACLHPSIQDAHKASCTHVNDHPGCFSENESSRLQVLRLCRTDFNVKGYILILEKICKVSILIHLPGVGVGERSSNFCWNLRKDSCTVTGTMQNNYLRSGTKVILMNIANASIFRFCEVAFCFWKPQMRMKCFNHPRLSATLVNQVRSLPSESCGTMQQLALVPMGALRGIRWECVNPARCVYDEKS